MVAKKVIEIVRSYLTEIGADGLVAMEDGHVRTLTECNCMLDELFWCSESINAVGDCMPATVDEGGGMHLLLDCEKCAFTDIYEPDFCRIRNTDGAMVGQDAPCAARRAPDGDCGPQAKLFECVF